MLLEDPPPNSTWKFCWPHNDPDGPDLIPSDEDSEGTTNFFGTAKFFAFPEGTKKFDPNAVISGYQQKSAFYPWYDESITAAVESPLTAVTINSKTLGEFTKYPLIKWDGESDPDGKCLRWRLAYACTINRGFQWNPF